MSEEATKQEGVSERADLNQLADLTEDLFNLMGESTYKRTENADPAVKCMAIFYAGLTLTAMHALLVVCDRRHKYDDAHLKAMNSFLEGLPADYLIGVVAKATRMGLMEPAQEEAGDGSA
jgi:hypothetical protein